MTDAADEPTPTDHPADADTPAAADAEIERWVRLALDGADDKSGVDSRAFHVGDTLGITDWFVITSGGSGRQVRAIVDNVEEVLTRAGGPKPLRIEGKDTATWVLMDYGTFVVHVFDAETREYYDLERLWRDMRVLER